MTVGQRFDFPNQLFDYETCKKQIFCIFIAKRQMEQPGWNQLSMTPWVGNMLELPQGWMLQVENHEFVWQPFLNRCIWLLIIINLII